MSRARPVLVPDRPRRALDEERHAHVTDQNDTTTEHDTATDTPQPEAPKKRFSDFALDPAMTDALEAQGISHPFPIQELTLPMALRGADIIGQARTGTGKTLGFGLPLLQRVDPELQRTQALVVVPTRELCLQVTDDLSVGAARGLTIQSVYGGVGFDEQIEALTTGVHVVVGTPGRLLDHLGRGNLDLSGVTELVLDEADEMLDMGFLLDVERLIEACTGENRHTMLFSATMPTAVVKLARRYMTQPTFMRAETEERDTAPNVDQHFFLVHRMDKPRVLARILQSPGRGSVYVFTRTKHMADRLVDELSELDVKAIAIHGDLRQGTREKNMDIFRDGKVDVLVATEVAARGLDVDNVTHVVNYDCPDDDKMYLHRIGRTARAGAAGVAVTFAEFNEVDRLNVIRKGVKAESTLLEVFSTSDELTELFDLPEERPWDHLARRGSSGGGSRSSSKGSSNSSSRGSSKGSSRDSSRGSSRSSSDDDGNSRSSGRGERDSGRDRKRPETDGRPKSSRRSEGGGADSSSDRDRTRRRASAEESETRTSSSGGPTAEDPPRLGERDEKAEVVRTRTRTRTRDEDASTDAGRGDDAKPRDGGRDTRSTGSSGRTRARASSTKESGTKDAGAKDSRERRSSGRDGEDSTPDEQPSGRSRDGGGRDRGSRDRQSSGGGSSRGGSRRGQSRGGSSRGGSRNGDSRRSEPQRSARDVIPGMVPTQQGDDARGEGAPQLSRRVKVEHLP
jgi:superfamily II DNA/RNA helicase